MKDLIIFPSDATFAPVSQAPGGRVHVLKFSSSDQRHFFWFQDNSPGKLYPITSPSIQKSSLTD